MPIGDLIAPVVDQQHLLGDGHHTTQLLQQSKTCPHCHAPLALPNANTEAPTAAAPHAVAANNTSPPSELPSSFVCAHCRGLVNSATAAFAGTGVESLPTVVAFIQPHADNRDRSSDGVRYVLPRSESKGMLIDERPTTSVVPTMGGMDRHSLQQCTPNSSSAVIHSSRTQTSPITIGGKSRNAASSSNRGPASVLSLKTSFLSTSPASPSPIPFPAHSAQHEADDDYPDPLADVTRLRVRSKGHKCLYPGATFEGTQKSGRTSYEVQVTIVVSISPMHWTPLQVSITAHDLFFIGRGLRLFLFVWLPAYPWSHGRLA